MPLKINKQVRKSANVIEGNVLRAPDGQLMSLFKSAMLPAVTLNVKQFAFPETFLVTDVRRVPVYVKNSQTGWDLKDENGNKTKTGEYNIQLQVTDGDAAQDLVNKGMGLDSLVSIQCTIKKDLPAQEFKPYETLLKLVKPVVMLGFGGRQADRILLVAEDCKQV